MTTRTSIAEPPADDETSTIVCGSNAVQLRDSNSWVGCGETALHVLMRGQLHGSNAEKLHGSLEGTTVSASLVTCILSLGIVDGGAPPRRPTWETCAGVDFSYAYSG